MEAALARRRRHAQDGVRRLRRGAPRRGRRDPLPALLKRSSRWRSAALPPPFLDVETPRSCSGSTQGRRLGCDPAGEHPRGTRTSSGRWAVLDASRGRCRVHREQAAGSTRTRRQLPRRVSVGRRAGRRGPAAAAELRVTASARWSQTRPARRPALPMEINARTEVAGLAARCGRSTSRSSPTVTRSATRSRAPPAGRRQVDRRKRTCRCADGVAKGSAARPVRALAARHAQDGPARARRPQPGLLNAGRVVKRCHAGAAREGRRCERARDHRLRRRAEGVRAARRMGARDVWRRSGAGRSSRATRAGRRRALAYAPAPVGRAYDPVRRRRRRVLAAGRALPAGAFGARGGDGRASPLAATRRGFSLPSTSSPRRSSCWLLGRAHDRRARQVRATSVRRQRVRRHPALHVENGGGTATPSCCAAPWRAPRRVGLEPLPRSERLGRRGRFAIALTHDLENCGGGPAAARAAGIPTAGRGVPCRGAPSCESWGDGALARPPPARRTDRSGRSR